MRKRVLVFIIMLLCSITSCGKETEKEPEIITLNITQIEDDYFLAKTLSQTLSQTSDMYKVYTNLDKDYCVGDSVVVSYEEMTYVEEKQYEITAIEIKPAPDYSEVVYKKPVIYLYPEQKTEVSVQLDFHGELTKTIPIYDDGWTVTAYPDGTLIDQNGTKYPYLFWEGEGNIDFDLSQGFCISGEETEQFLREKLELMGLNEKELSEFIEYWVPYMEENPYNIISFQTKAYTDIAKLTVIPNPDSVLRVFMVYQPSDQLVELKEQSLQEFERTGFTLIEWGGCEIKK